MQVEVVIPPVGESITEGVLAEWLKAEGELVLIDEPLFVLETDKVTMTINAAASGRLAIVVQAGEPVKIGQVVGRIDAAAAGEAAVPRPPAKAPSPPPPLPAVPRTPGPPIVAPAGLPQASEKVAAMERSGEFSPSVRRIVEEFRLDTSKIHGTGREGRLTKEDVIRHLDAPASATPAPPALPSSQGPAPPPPKGARQTRSPLSPIRQRIAERMLLSQQGTATLTTFAEADLGALVELRRKHREEFKARHGVDLTYLPFFVQASVEALKAVPALRTTIDQGDLVQNNHFDIGVAVAVEHGLSVPVLRDPETKGIPQIQLEIEELAKRVRERRITLQDLSGGVFTITNAGSYGALMGTPILNPPQSGILGMYAIQERPVAKGVQVVIRPMMYLALSYDHRCVDGKEAGSFLKRVAEVVENPAVLMLELSEREGENDMRGRFKGIDTRVEREDDRL